MICRDEYHTSQFGVVMMAKSYQRLWIKFVAHSVGLRPALQDKLYDNINLFPAQGSRVRPHFSMVRLKEIPGRTGATSCSSKKRSATLKVCVVNNRHTSGPCRGLNQSEMPNVRCSDLRCSLRGTFNFDFHFWKCFITFDLWCEMTRPQTVPAHVPCSTTALLSAFPFNL